MQSPDHFANEREIVLLARSGDRDAFSQLVDAYDRRLIYFIRRILNEHDAALDVLQSVWLAVHRKLPTLKEPGAFRVWLYRIAHDKAVAELRTRTRQPLFVEDIAACGGPASEDSTELAFDNAESIHLGMQRLSVDHRRILTLRFLEDMKVKEISEVLGCSDGTVKSRLHHARRALRQQIQEMQNE